jgi:hypothetical protein
VVEVEDPVGVAVAGSVEDPVAVHIGADFEPAGCASLAHGLTHPLPALRASSSVIPAAHPPVSTIPASNHHVRMRSRRL